MNQLIVNNDIESFRGPTFYNNSVFFSEIKKKNNKKKKDVEIISLLVYKVTDNVKYLKCK